MPNYIYEDDIFEKVFNKSNYFNKNSLLNRNVSVNYKKNELTINTKTKHVSPIKINNNDSNEICVRFLTLHKDPVFFPEEYISSYDNFLSADFLLNCFENIELKFSVKNFISDINSIKDVSKTFFLKTKTSLVKNKEENLDIFNTYNHIISSLSYKNVYFFCFFKIINFEQMEKEDNLLDIKIYLENMKINSYYELYNEFSKKPNFSLESIVWNNFCDFFQNKKIELTEDRVFDL